MKRGKVPGNNLKAKSAGGSMASSLSGTVPGAVNKALPQRPMPGPTNPGQPISMKKALARKAPPSKGL